MNRLLKAGLNSLFPKSPPGFIVARRRKSGWALIRSEESEGIGGREVKKVMMELWEKDGEYVRNITREREEMMKGKRNGGKIGSKG